MNCVAFRDQASGHRGPANLLWKNDLGFSFYIPARDQLKNSRFEGLNLKQRKLLLEIKNVTLLYVA